jgi:hypothetical protein
VEDNLAEAMEVKVALQVQDTEHNQDRLDRLDHQILVEAVEQEAKEEITMARLELGLLVLVVQEKFGSMLDKKEKK